MKLVLDTDVVVAALRSSQGASRAWLEAVLRREVDLILSVPLILQYEEVLMRPDHLAAGGLSSRDVGVLLDALCAVCQPVEISFLWRPVLRDPTDEMVLEAAVSGEADRILTFNEGDYEGSEHFRIQVMRPGPAWRKWKGEAS